MRFARVIAACGLAVLAACGEDDILAPPPGPPVASAGILISDNTFGPRTVRLSAGGNVTWTWTGANVHNLVFTSGVSPIPSGVPIAVSSGPPYTGTFTSLGQYNFRCNVHNGMNGAIFVE